MSHASDLGGKVDIKPRRMSFPFKDIKDRFFYKGNSVISAFGAALSSTFPPGEAEFIASVRLYRDKVKDEKLQQQIRGFIGQEGHHSHQHKQANLVLKELGIDAVRLEKHLEKDTSKYIVSELTSLGLVQLTRKRTRESLEHVLCEMCPTCEGRGKLKTTETVCYEIFREIIRESRQFEAQKLMVVASQQVVDMLMDDESINLAELEETLEKPITFQVEPYYTQEQYDIVPL